VKKSFSSIFLCIAVLSLSACGKSSTGSSVVPTDPPETVDRPLATPEPAGAETAAPPEPTPFVSVGWSTTASSRTELSFAFPGEWDGSSPLTFGEGEFIKDPDQAIGMTFQIGLSGDPEALLSDWGKKDVGIIGIVTFAPESVMDSPGVTVARISAATKTAQGEGLTARVVYLPRAGDVLEIMWFAPADQWETLQPVFQDVLKSVEIWRRYTNREIGLNTMYVHDWLEPSPTDPEEGLWFHAADKRTGVLLYVHGGIADPVEKLGEWDPERLGTLGYGGCTSEAGDRMGVLGGQWESLTGACTDSAGKTADYEISFIPDKDRLLEIITYAPAEEWESANEKAFGYLLGMMIDVR
jgi:hypothetical protein